MPNKGKAVSCGCEIDSAGMGIVWCPLHAAAEEMRSELAAIHWREDGPECMVAHVAPAMVARIRAQLAKVERR